MTDDATAALLARFGQRPFLTDGGLETHLIHDDGLNLPEFAAFPLLRQNTGRIALEQYYCGFLDEAEALNMGFVLDTVTWRASVGWGARMGWAADDIDDVNREAVAFARGLLTGRAGEIVINGVVGPHGDADRPETALTAAEAQVYHSRQIDVLAEAGVDLVTAMTLTSVPEAIGIAQAARTADVPVALSFTLETDGRLLDGTTLEAAVLQTDAATDGYPAWYGINCAHPDHFVPVLTGDFVGRIGSVRGNASRLSRAELDAAAGLDAGDPEELAMDYEGLCRHLPQLRVLGGCCGTDLPHIAAIGRRFANQL